MSELKKALNESSHKIVDDFNGCEYPARYATLDEAEIALDAAIADHRKTCRENGADVACCLTVVTSDAEWIFDHAADKSCWA